MKKYILIFSVLIFSASHLFGQHSDAKEKGDRTEMMERIKAKKVAFLTTKMDLTPDEAGKFWPVYNAYEKRLDEIKSSYNKHKDFNDLSDAEIEKHILDDFEKRQKFLEINREAFDDYKKILPMKKIAKLRHYEREFTKEVLHRYKNRTKEKAKNK